MKLNTLIDNKKENNQNKNNQMRGIYNMKMTRTNLTIKLLCLTFTCMSIFAADNREITQALDQTRALLNSSYAEIRFGTSPTLGSILRGLTNAIQLLHAQKAQLENTLTIQGQTFNQYLHNFNQALEAKDGEIAEKNATLIAHLNEIEQKETEKQQLEQRLSHLTSKLTAISQFIGSDTFNPNREDQQAASSTSTTSSPASSSSSEEVLNENISANEESSELEDEITQRTVAQWLTALSDIDSPRITNPAAMAEDAARDTSNLAYASDDSDNDEEEHELSSRNAASYDSFDSDSDNSESNTETESEDGLTSRYSKEDWNRLKQRIDRMIEKSPEDAEDLAQQALDTIRNNNQTEFETSALFMVAKTKQANDKIEEAKELYTYIANKCKGLGSGTPKRYAKERLEQINNDQRPASPLIPTLYDRKAAQVAASRLQEQATSTRKRTRQDTDFKSRLSYIVNTTLSSSANETDSESEDASSSSEDNNDALTARKWQLIGMRINNALRSGRNNDAYNLAQKTLERAQNNNQPQFICQATYALAKVYQALGNIDEAKEAYTYVVQHADHTSNLPAYAKKALETLGKKQR